MCDHIAFKEVCPHGWFVRSVYRYFQKGCRKNVHATIPKGNMGCDQQFTLSWHCSCRTYFCCFPFALSNIRPSSKTFRLTSLQKPKLQPVQSPVRLSICAFFCISCAIYFFSVLSGYFYVSLNLMACSQCLNMTQLLWSLALRMSFEAPSFGHLYCLYSD